MKTEVQVDSDAGGGLVPVLSVQPLVENAIKHGLSTRPDEGCLRVSAKVHDSMLTITVEDSGSAPEVRQHSSAGPGVGLANVSRRLQLCFGPDAAVTMQQSALGTTVQFSVPAGDMVHEPVPAK